MSKLFHHCVDLCLDCYKLLKQKQNHYFRSCFIFLFNLFSFVFMLCFVFSFLTLCYLLVSYSITLFLCTHITDLMFCVHALCFCVFCFSSVPVMTGFCGNLILKIAPLQRPTGVASSAGSSPLLMHDSFIAHYHPTLISSQPGSPALISDGDGCVGGGVVATIKPVCPCCDWLVGSI